MSQLIGFPCKGVNTHDDMQYVYNKHYKKNFAWGVSVQQNRILLQKSSIRWKGKGNSAVI